MYAEYAKDPRMRANVGIRRRLAPLLENDRNQIELFTALLLSLPGSPVLYYGDEIGMGDNIWLGDRDGVRTPMQWTPDRNAGFSRANPGRLYLPANQDPVYGYQSVNVEAQRDSSTSLLQLDPARCSRSAAGTTAFAVGTFRELGGSNPSVLAFLREHGDDVVLCVNNLSRFPQPIELNLQHWNGYTPVELTGRVHVPAHRPAAVPADPARARLLLVPAASAERREEKPVMTLPFADWLPQQRWYAGRSRTLAVGRAGVGDRRCATTSTTCCSTSPTPTAARERYQVFVGWDSRRRSPSTARSATIGADGDRTGYDALLRPERGRAVPAGADRRRRDRRRRAVRAGARTSTLPGRRAGRGSSTPSRATPASSSSSAAILKVFRRVPTGHQPRPRAQPGARPGPAARTWPGCSARSRRTDDAASRARSAWSPRTRRTPPRAGRWPPPAPATCSPTPTCTPTRWAATSPASRTGSARRSPSVHRDAGRRSSAPAPAPFPVDAMLARLADAAGSRAGAEPYVAGASRQRSASWPASRSPCSASTATCTSGRCCARRRAGC